MESTLWLRASPKGKHSGFAVMPDGAGGRITVTVLPKTWGPDLRHAGAYDHAPGATTHMSLYEGEVALISSSRSVVTSLVGCLSTIAKDQADLLTLGTPVPLNETPTRPRQSFKDLVSLVLMGQRAPMVTDLDFAGSLGQTLLRTVAQGLFLNEVTTLIFRSRPQYRPRTDELTVPRGRLDEQGLLFSIATGMPRLTSTFDDLTIDTELLRIIAATLRVIATDRLPTNLAFLGSGLGARALNLLGHLSGVNVIDRARAIHLAERCHLGPMDRAWQPALDAALPVLRDWSVIPQDEVEDTDALHLSIPTDAFWEQCLELALTTAFEGVSVSNRNQQDHMVRVPAPFAAPVVDRDEPLVPSTSLPDYMFKTRQRTVVADAKYKLRSSARPSSSDSYQLFSYSYLATLAGNESDFAVLLYPQKTSGTPTQSRLDRLPDRNYSLWMAHLPFPSPADLATQQSWDGYVSRLAATLSDFSQAWHTSSRVTATT